MRPRSLFAGALGVVALTAGGAWLVLPRAGRPSDPVAVAATGTARVERVDLVTTQQVAGTIGFGATATLMAPPAAPAAVVTALPAVGGTVAQGQAPYAVDGRPVPLLYGAVPAYRALHPGVQGDDVRQLEQDLLALGFATSANLTADGTFTSADAAAVGRWQVALGVPRTGALALGDAVFLPGPIRVTALRATAGGSLAGGQPVLDYTATTRLVTVPLAPALSAQVRPGDAVTIDLPDGRTSLPGKVAGVGTVATAAQSPGFQTQNGAPQATIPVIITFDDPSRAGAYDQAPVIVDVTTQAVRAVLAVPVGALLALAGGGYGVEVVDADGRHRLLSVQTGIFDNSRVQVSGTGLNEGQRVVVPSP